MIGNEIVLFWGCVEGGFGLWGVVDGGCCCGWSNGVVCDKVNKFVGGR